MDKHIFHLDLLLEVVNFSRKRHQQKYCPFCPNSQCVRIGIPSLSKGVCLLHQRGRCLSSFLLFMTCFGPPPNYAFCPFLSIFPLCSKIIGHCLLHLLSPKGASFVPPPPGCLYVCLLWAVRKVKANRGKAGAITSSPVSNDKPLPNP